MGRLRAESLNLVDAELSVRITPDGYVTVSSGDNARPLATGVASKKEAGIPATISPPGDAIRNGFPLLLLLRLLPLQPPAVVPATPDNSQGGLLAGLD